VDRLALWPYLVPAQPQLTFRVCPVKLMLLTAAALVIQQLELLMMLFFLVPGALLSLAERMQSSLLEPPASSGLTPTLKPLMVTQLVLGGSSLPRAAFLRLAAERRA
jgi:hypothetical protein